jgi:hypothetical protein
MQPVYVTISSSTTGSPSPWKLTNWQATPFDAAFAIIANSSSSFNIDLTYEDPTGVYPNPNSSSPTAFSLISSGSSSQVIVPSSFKPFAGYRYTVNTVSSVGGKVQFIYLQAGIG